MRSANARLSTHDIEVLDNVVWHALTTSHAAFAVGNSLARRYPSDVTVFAAIESDSPPSWDALAALATAGERFVLSRAEAPTAPPAWQESRIGLGNQMVLDTLAAPTSEPDIALLTTEHVTQILELVGLELPASFWQLAK